MDLHEYDRVVINSSAGKDSLAMLDYLVELASQQNYPLGKLVVVHADLGRVEWAGTRELAKKQAELFSLAFEVVSRPQGDLLTHIEKRGKFPSSSARYCTSDHKRGQCARFITALTKTIKAQEGERKARILNCMGFRADESTARAKRPVLSRDARLSNGKRDVDQWLPIHAWSEELVWRRIRERKLPYHAAYDLGMPRLSCVFCIFAPKAALLIAAKANPELLDEYCAVEERIGHKFTQKMAISEIRDAVRQGEEVSEEAMVEMTAWNM